MKKIALERARELAEEDAANIKVFLPIGEDLFAQTIEGQYCWAFLLNKKIRIPDSVSLGVKWAFFVSHWGQTAMAYDFSDDPKEMADYLEKMSMFFYRKAHKT